VTIAVGIWNLCLYFNLRSCTLCNAKIIDA